MYQQQIKRFSRIHKKNGKIYRYNLRSTTKKFFFSNLWKKNTQSCVSAEPRSDAVCSADWQLPDGYLELSSGIHSQCKEMLPIITSLHFPFSTKNIINAHIHSTLNSYAINILSSSFLKIFAFWMLSFRN